MNLKYNDFKIKISPYSENDTPSIVIDSPDDETLAAIYVYNYGLSYGGRMYLRDQFLKSIINIYGGYITMEEQRDDGRYGTLLSPGLLQMTKNDQILWEQKI